MEILIVLLMLAAGVFLLRLFFKIMRLELKWLFKLALSAAAGFVALFIFNFLGTYIGVSLEMNLVSALITGILGVPGVIILLIFKYII